MVITALALANPVTVRADEGITVVSNSHENHFPESIIFRLQARSDALIERVTFLYSRSDTRVSSVMPLARQPQPLVDTEAVIRLNRTFIPPTTEISYWWRIEDQLGRQLETQPSSFILLDSRFQWDTIAGDEVTVYAYGHSLSEMKTVLKAAQRGLILLEGEMGLRRTGPVHIVLYESNEDMAGALELGAKEIDFAGMQLSDQVAVMDNAFPDVVVHELTHIVLRQFMGAEFRYQTIPEWLNEGLAEYMSSLYPSLSYSLEYATLEDLPALRSLRRPTEEEKIDLFYGQSWSVVKFMIDEYGIDRFKTLLERFRQGTRADDALMSVYGLTMVELDAAWRKTLDLPSSHDAEPSDAQSLESGADRGLSPLLLFASGVVVLLSIGVGGAITRLFIAEVRKP